MTTQQKRQLKSVIREELENILSEETVSSRRSLNEGIYEIEKDAKLLTEIQKSLKPMMKIVNDSFKTFNKLENSVKLIEGNIGKISDKELIKQINSAYGNINSDYWDIISKIEQLEESIEFFTDDLEGISKPYLDAV